MIINHNMLAINTHRQMGTIGVNQSKSMEKLSSGMRINRAGDDAAGLAISEKMRAQVRGLNQASRNSQDGISMIQTGEGALSETHDMLQRMRELIVQAKNGTNSAEDRDSIQKEITELQTEITGITERTEFNTMKLLDGSLGKQLADGTGTTAASYTAEAITIDVSGSVDATSFNVLATAGGIILSTDDGTLSQQILTAGNAVTAGTVLNFDKIGIKMSFGGNIDFTAFDAKTFGTAGTSATINIGANGGQELNIGISNMDADHIGLGTGSFVSDINVSTDTLSFDKELDIVDNALTQVSGQRAQLGAWQNRLEHTIKNLDTSKENLQAAESRIRDVDMAKEMMNFTKNNILQQAAQAMLAQANQAPQGVLQLLR